MIVEAKKKNYYFLETIKNEIEKYKIISFDLFDTLVLRKVLFPQDIFKILDMVVNERYGLRDFRYIRLNVENEIRNQSDLEDINIDDIYMEIGRRYPEIPIDEIKALEYKIELENIIPNPYIKQIFEYAKMKDIWIITDMYLPKEFLEEILEKCGYNGYKKIYISGEIGKSKASGALYKHILEENSVAISEWMHVGDDYHRDVNVPRALGITAAYVRSPRDWFLMTREKEHERKVEEEKELMALEPLDDSLEYSVKISCKINEIFTQLIEPQKEIVINVKDTSIMFNMSSEKVDNIKEYIIRLIKGELNFKEFWALKNISFNVRRGEKIGLVGLNGSGKSTLLKIISGVMKPTKGSVSVTGIIAPLIELGAGFDFELSARENVYLNGAILGYSRQDMEKYYEQIIDFAELKDFEDVAIKNFSSGMIARLGFAIATSHVPDILIIDEILSVGDFEFQRKCHKRMEELTKEGTTVLFVSHSATDIINMCDKVIWLSHGNLVQEGEAQYIVEKYLN